MEENEKLLNDDSDQDNTEENKDENTVNVINTGRMQFSKSKGNKGGEEDDDNSEDEEQKPIKITTSSSLKVSGPINVNVKPEELKPVFEVEEFKVDEVDNPWLGDSDNVVQGSKKQVNLTSKSNKQQKALEKLSQEKKKANKGSILNNEINFDEMKQLEHVEVKETTAKLSIAQDQDQTSKVDKSNNESIKETLEKERNEEEQSEQIDKIVAGLATENSNDIEEEDNFQSITRGDLLQMAFAENDVFEDEFNDEKQQLIDEENAPEVEDSLPGWVNILNIYYNY